MKEYALKTYEGYHPRILVTDDFVKKNGFCLSRSQDEIMEKMRDAQAKMLDFSSEVYINYLTKNNAVKFLSEEYIEKCLSGEETCITDINETTQDLLDYMVFGWMKALDQRGISAGRTIHKIGAWLWLLGRIDLYDLIHNDDLYNPYGTPALIAVCEKLGIEVPADVIAFSKNKEP